MTTRRSSRSAIAALVCACMLMVAGCSLFSLPAPDAMTELPTGRALVEGASSPWPPPGAHAMTPFPWGWVFGVLFVGALATVGAVLKAPTLVDEVIVVTVGAVAVVASIELVREVWQAKWAIAFTVGLVAALLALWKIGRKWWLSK